MKKSFNLNSIDNYLQRIANVLLINSSFINNIGLINGKTGISVFFYHYYEYTGNKIYEEYAGELIDEIYEEIHQSSPIDYADGLAGLGTGIAYLVKNGFIEADIDEVLADVDKQLQHHTFHHTPLGLDVCFGISGFGNYFVSRLSNHSDKPESEARASNKECIRKIIDTLNQPYNSYNDILSVINLLSGLYSVMPDQPKCIWIMPLINLKPWFTRMFILEYIPELLIR
jgi:lantibiotic modifying enzyme